MSNLSPRIVQQPPGGYPGATVLAWEYLGKTRYTSSMENKFAIVNAGWLLVLGDGVPTRQVSCRLTDGRRVQFSGSYVNDRDILLMARHYLWQDCLDYRHALGPFEVPPWMPQLLPDAFSTEQTEYAPVKGSSTSGV